MAAPIAGFISLVLGLAETAFVRAGRLTKPINSRWNDGRGDAKWAVKVEGQRHARLKHWNEFHLCGASASVFMPLSGRRGCVCVSEQSFEYDWRSCNLATE